MSITAFLTARYDEEEAVAREADEVGREGWGPGAGWETSVGWDSDYGAVPWVSLSPERALADIAAKRAIVKRHEPYDDIQVRRQTRSLAGDTLRLLAQPYADHPDFDERWLL